MSSISHILNQKRISVKIQTLATICAIITAVALPQLFHLIGNISGLGKVPGVAFLPMHLPIIMVGLLAGAYAGAVAGFLSPAVSFSISGMPPVASLPFMMVELCIYGLVSGLLRNARMSSFFKVLVAQLAGRIFYAIAIVSAIHVFGNQSLHISSAWTGTTTGLYGILLQWTLIPLVLYRVKGKE
ncbi:MAG: ECF transporter S component [Clostridia bacterium]|nr:ECF transporter S component [Clostridia bacterium]